MGEDFQSESTRSGNSFDTFKVNKCFAGKESDSKILASLSEILESD